MKKIALALAFVSTLGVLAACGKPIPQHCDKKENKTLPECLGG